MKVRVALFLSLVVVSHLLLWSQAGTTSMHGTVTDASGAIVTKAKVTLTDPTSGFERSVMTGEAGEYQFVQVAPGSYTLTVEMAGFRAYKENGIQLLVNLPKTNNVVLTVGASSETVEVSGETAAVNTTDASLGNVVGEIQVRNLPLEGRNVPDLLSLQAGVAYTGNRSDINQNADTRSGAVNGAHSDQSNLTLDGVDVNDQVNGYAFTSVLPVTLDSVQEFRVSTTNYNADQGRSSGAQVSLVTKGGTNEFHGSLYEYHRNTATSANDYFVKQSQLASGQANEPPKLIRNIFGASFGGPIIKNRLFFFLNYEGYRQAEENSTLRIVPSDAMRDGVITYACGDPSECPGMTVNGYNGPHNIPAGYYALTPDQIAGMDLANPSGILGNNPVVIPYLNTFPHGNDTSAGDGVNYVGYRFKGPVPKNDNWYIARLDYRITENGNHSLFWRGALRNDNHQDPPYFLGTAPLQTRQDYSKGFALGYAAVLRPTLVNNFRWGYTRQSVGFVGNNDTDPFIFFRGLNDNSTTNNSTLAVVRSSLFQTPVHNFVDDLTWTKGRHTLQFGTNVRIIRNPRSNFINSFPDAVTNASALDTAGMANKDNPLNPALNGFPAVDEGFDNSYDFPLMTMMGLITQLDASYNFTRDGQVLPEGAPVSRRWGANEFEFYGQDSFRVRPNLTITYGLRWSLYSPPWETNGTQVTPNMSLGKWFDQRRRNMEQGIGSEADPVISFDLAGPANGKPGYYNWDYHNFAPRIAFAYTPGSGKTVIRGGFGMVYDHIGSGLLNTFDQRGSFGLSTQLSNSTVFSVGTAPRVTGLNTIPMDPASGFPPPPVPGFPYTPPSAGTGLGIYWGLDDSVKTPYTYTVDFSVARELPRNMSVTLSYVGHYAHRLLAQEDLAMPLNLKDPASGVNYFEAASALAKLYQGPNAPVSTDVTPAMVGPTAAYWQNIMTPLQPGDQYTLLCPESNNGPFATSSALQAVYNIYSCFSTNETTALATIDFYGTNFDGTPGIQGTSGNFYPFKQGGNTFFNDQFHSLYAWRSIGSASYNALQVNLKKVYSQGIQFDFNYTYSKSIDQQSDAERVDAWSGLSGNIINSWSPDALRGVSDFDNTHQINANFLAELPFGKGKPVGANANGFLNAIIGGWQLSGLARWSSGFPVGISNGFTWPTNWQLGGSALVSGHPETHLTRAPDGTPNIFPDPQGPTGIGAFRHALPGESGSRNSLRGPGYAGLDLGLSKRWVMPYSDHHSLQFRWEVFNVFNQVRFDVQTLTTGLDAGPSFGQFSGLLTNPRVMQFAMRYEF